MYRLGYPLGPVTPQLACASSQACAFKASLMSGTSLTFFFGLVGSLYFSFLAMVASRESRPAAEPPFCPCSCAALAAFFRCFSKVFPIFRRQSVAAAIVMRPRQDGGSEARTTRIS